MENQIKWHYSPMSQEEYEQACYEIGDFQSGDANVAAGAGPP
jgi:hypothetical protein